MLALKPTGGTPSSRGRVDDGADTLNGSVTTDRDKPAELFERVARIHGDAGGVRRVRRQGGKERRADGTRSLTTTSERR